MRCGETTAADARGFLLLEVLVGLAILALALGVLLQIFGSALRATALAQEYAQATLLAEAEMARIGVEEPIEEGVRDVEIDGKYHGRIAVEPYAGWDDEESGALRPYQVTVEISWGGGGAKTHSLALATVRLSGAQ